MSYTVLMISDKVNFRGFKTLEEAQEYCADDAAPITLIFEGMSSDDIFYQRYSDPLEIYIEGKQYDVSRKSS